MPTYPEHSEEKLYWSQYAAQLQISTLKIGQLIQPILDIGCGEDALLVEYLRNEGIEAYGIDIHHFSKPYLTTASWKHYDYGINRWGTIISHFAFTNPSIPGYLDKEWETIFYRILYSLKKGGFFYSSPEVIPSRVTIDKELFIVSYEDIDDFDFKVMKIEKL
jgi:hypothetical protein